jgi:succinate dehydrogenase flavin-adding protein (antitoxin of CptAB toxin-antitoxin module)
MEPAKKTEKGRDESYKELLTENDWPLFNVLREWRASERKIKVRIVRKGDLMHILNCCIHLSIR